MKVFRAIVGEGGRLFIPSELRKKMKIEPGDELLLQFDDYSVYMLTMKQAVKEAQATMKQFTKSSLATTTQLTPNSTLTKESVNE